PTNRLPGNLQQLPARKSDQPQQHVQILLQLPTTHWSATTAGAVSAKRKTTTWPGEPPSQRQLLRRRALLYSNRVPPPLGRRRPLGHGVLQVLPTQGREDIEAAIQKSEPRAREK